MKIRKSKSKKNIFDLIKVFVIFLGTAQLLAIVGSTQLLILEEHQFIIRPIATWYPWGIVGFFIFALSKRWFKNKRSIKNIIVILIAIGPIFVCICVVIQSILMWIPNRGELNLLTLSVERLITRVYIGILIYICIVLGLWTYLRFCRLRIRNREASLLADQLAKTEIDGMKDNFRLERVLNSLNKIRNNLVLDSQIAEIQIAKLARSLRKALRKYKNLSQEFQSQNHNVQKMSSTIIASSRGNNVKRGLLLIGIFTLVVLFFSLRDVLAAKLQNRQFEFFLTIKQNLYWYVWVFLTLPILVMERIFPLKDPVSLRNLVIHIFAAVLGGLGCAALLIAINYLAGIHQSESFFDQLKTFPLVIDFIIYWSIIAIATKVRISTSEELKQAEMAELEAGLSIARLNLLRNQLHPHFLFNSLNTLCELLHENIHQAKQMLTNIERFLRYSMELGETHEVKLSTELQLLNYYLQIQQLRFQEKLIVKTDIHQDAMSLKVPSLILQPLVENSIQHGSSGQSALQINIQVQTMNDHTHIKIIDNGKGLKKDFTEGVGLSNTRRRLETLYGDRHSFLIQGSHCGGVSISLKIPRRLEI